MRCKETRYYTENSLANLKPISGVFHIESMTEINTMREMLTIPITDRFRVEQDGKSSFSIIVSNSPRMREAFEKSAQRDTKISGVMKAVKCKILLLIKSIIFTPIGSSVDDTNFPSQTDFILKYKATT